MITWGCNRCRAADKTKENCKEGDRMAQSEYVCDCGKVYTEIQAFRGHKSHCAVHLQKTGRYQLRKDAEKVGSQKAGKTIHEIAVKRREEADAAWLATSPKCERCGKPLTLEKVGSRLSRRFCSIACANARPHSEEEKKKISGGVKRYLATDDYWENHFTPVQSPKEQPYKQELLLRYKRDEISTRCMGKVNGHRVFPDFVIRSQKIIIEVDGEHHFCNEFRSIDYDKTKFFLSEGYRVIRIDDKLDYVQGVLTSAIDSDKSLVLVGDRYSHLEPLLA